MELKETEFQDKKIIRWLMNGDPAICWQGMKDLKGESEKIFEEERKKIVTRGWGAKLLLHNQERSLANQQMEYTSSFKGFEEVFKNLIRYASE